MKKNTVTYHMTQQDADDLERVARILLKLGDRMSTPVRARLSVQAYEKVAKPMNFRSAADAVHMMMCWAAASAASGEEEAAYMRNLFDGAEEAGGVDVSVAVLGPKALPVN
jgi:hypothetical protein